MLEADSRPGGKIGSERINGFLCEKGPGGFLDNKPTTLQLCDSLGLTPLRSNDSAKKRFLLSKSYLNPLPESPSAFLKSRILSWKGKLRIPFEIFAPKGPPDETVAAFVTRRLGKETLDQLIDPMVSGVYAGDPQKMSITSAFPRIKELEQQYGSLIRAFIKIRGERKKQSGSQARAKVSTSPGGTLTSFDNGVQALTDTLAVYLGEKLRTNVAAHSIEKSGSGYLLHTSQGSLEADIVVLASPAFVSAGILREFDLQIAQVLDAIPYPHVSVVCLGYKKENVTYPLNGFGFLIPHNENRKILGTLWDSSIFTNRAEQGSVLLRTMIGGAKFPEMAELEETQLQAIVLSELQEILGLKGDPEMVRVYKWAKAIPQYLVGHQGILTQIEQGLKKYPGLYLTGNAYRGIGMNDCIANSYQLAEIIQ